MYLWPHPVKMSRLAEGPVTPPPRLGEHTDEVLRELLHMSAAEIARLRAAGIV